LGFFASCCLLTPGCVRACTRAHERTSPENLIRVFRLFYIFQEMANANIDMNYVFFANDISAGM
jgi:hypothetical protein